MILDEIASKTKIRIEQEKQLFPTDAAKKAALALDAQTGFPFFKALKKNGLSYICEVKKASPSKGIIAENFPYLQIAADYEKAGASAISVLTEPYYFKGSDSYLTEISKSVSIPIIRKDFTIDEHQIYTAKLIGASAVLLICALLDIDTIKQYIEICRTLGLSALVEAHDEYEVETALNAGADIIGVNNRNLKDFTVDINNCLRLRKLVPESCVFVAESGIKTADDISALKENGVDAVLIGETLMRAPDKTAALRELNGGEI
ncbi:MULTISPECIES: indole-3-glycerol phosphate synthase TrpC [unclassified Ruminococcus]|uniref:indole-3-glycerol phosphate synthase TrpC n=1 Tax=unclassified Ruminococcus TaxID=2608920 RepID=UPI002108B25E|nr:MULTISPECIES: indole-3-glycerol phosphate synthase TrpC [unclassified Ruminococcus]